MFPENEIISFSFDAKIEPFSYSLWVIIFHIWWNFVSFSHFIAFIGIFHTIFSLALGTSSYKPVANLFASFVDIHQIKTEILNLYLLPHNSKKISIFALN